MMKLDVKALAMTGGILWGGCFFLVGVANRLFPPYGNWLLRVGSSIYPGYHGPGGGFRTVAIVTLYAVVDGAICGFIFGWLYNRLAGAKDTA